MNIYDQLKQLWARVTGLEKSNASLAPLIPKIPKDYSTTETDTGVKWVDGEPIYRRTVVFEEDQTITTSPFTKEILTYDNINIIGMDGVVIKHDTIISFFDTSDYRSATDYVYMSVNSQSKLIINGRFSGGYFGGACITVYYTKTAGTRVPDVYPDMMPEEPETKATKAAKKKATK